MPYSAANNLPHSLFNQVACSGTSIETRGPPSAWCSSVTSLMWRVSKSRRASSCARMSCMMWLVEPRVTAWAGDGEARTGSKPKHRAWPPGTHPTRTIMVDITLATRADSSACCVATTRTKRTTRQHHGNNNINELAQPWTHNTTRLDVPMHFVPPLRQRSSVGHVQDA